MDVVDRPRGVGARTLAGPGEGVHPPVLETLPDRGHVLAPQRLDGFQDQGFPTLDGEAQVGLHQGRVDVIVAELLDAQHAGAQLEVAVERGEVGVGLLDEGAVDGLGNVVAVQGRRQAGGILPGLCVEEIALHL